MDDPSARCSTVLVVEDDPDITEAFRTALESDGYQVLTAENGQRALELLEGTPTPCLILLDLFMPVMDGWQFLSKLREGRRDAVASVPIVVVSAAGDRAVATATGADGFMKKPIDLDLLLATVGRYCGHGRATR